MPSCCGWLWYHLFNNCTAGAISGIKFNFGILFDNVLFKSLLASVPKSLIILWIIIVPVLFVILNIFWMPQILTVRERNNCVGLNSIQASLIVNF